MANEEHLAILKKGMEAWLDWRYTRGNEALKPDLSGANLSGFLHGAYLDHVGDMGTVYFRANFADCNLRGATLQCPNSVNCDADFARADLRESRLINLRFKNLDFSGCDLTGAVLGYCEFIDVDLTRVKGLETVRHEGPSSIGIDTIYRSKGKIPEVFLRGAGVPEPFIVQMKALVGAMEPIEFYSCFISYSSKDREFAERLYTDLQQEHVRCWFAPEDMKIGDKFRQRIDEAIRVYDKLLLVLTESSMKSAWVEKEVETAFEKERKQGRTVLFPIRLDEAVMEAEGAWAADIRRTRHIGDFVGWKEHDKYKKGFERLIRDLKAGT